LKEIERQKEEEAAEWRIKVRRRSSHLLFS